MTIALRKPLTRAQFLAWEDRQELRFEFDGVRPIAMTGGTEAHAAIQRNLITALTTRLRGQPGRPYGSELKVQTAESIRYPDAFVTCTLLDPRSKIATEPVVVFEILSESTASTDLVIKNDEYRRTPSICRYVVLQQTSSAAIVFSHRGGEWATDLISGPDAVLPLPEIGIDLPLGEIYDGILFPDDADNAQ